MIVLIEKQFHELEEQRKKLFEDVGKLTHEQQNFKPAPGKWSILQVFNHLITSESNSLIYLSKKIQGVNTVKKAGIGSKLRSTALNFFLRLPVKYKAPQLINVTHEDIYIYENITKKWDDLRGEIAKFLDQLTPEIATKEIFRHPIAGRMNIYQALSFMKEHIGHHKKQIERIRTSEGFSK